jgi:dipeptidyl aminopeptidase/acylaminoacyl peptidase
VKQRVSFIRPLLLAITLALTTPLVAAADLIEAFVGERAAEDPVLSPDGQSLAYFGYIQGQKFIAIASVGSTQPVIVRLDDIVAQQLFWAGNDHVVVTASQAFERFNNFVVRGFQTFDVRVAYSIDARTGEATRLLRTDRVAEDNFDLGNVQGFKRDGDEVVALMSARSTRNRYLLFRVDLDTGRGVQLDRAGEDPARWFTDAEGTPVLRVDTSRTDRTIKIFHADGSDWHPVLSDTLENLSQPRVLGLADDGASVVIAHNDPVSDFRLAEKFAIASGQSLERYTVDGAEFAFATTDKFSSEVTSLRFASGYEDTVWFEPRVQAVARALEQFSEDAFIALQSWDDAKRNFVVYVEQPQRAGSYLLFEARSGNFTPLAPLYPALVDQELAPVKSFRFAARDGQELEGFITVPAHHSAHKPLVMLPHGGPASRDSIAYDWERQLLAAHGYAVLQVNFRGSTGYGQAFEEAGYGEWGIGVAQHDVTDAVRYAIDQGWGNEDAVAILGASYGGYVAMAGAAFTPDIYQCAVSINGISDLPHMIEQERLAMGRDSWVLTYWQDATGDTIGGRELLQAASPRNSVDAVDIPVLLIAGDKDSVVQKDQSIRMHRALQRANKNSTYVELAELDHWYSSATERKALYRNVMGFLGDCLQP